MFYVTSLALNAAEREMKIWKDRLPYLTCSF